MLLESVFTVFSGPVSVIEPLLLKWPTCQTDFLSLHIIIVQREVQVSADTILGTCKSKSQKTFRFSHPDIINPSRLSCRNSNIFIMSVYESDQTDVAKKCVSLNVFCEQWTVAIQMMSIFSWCAPVTLEWQKVSGIVGLMFSKESLEIPAKAVCVCISPY